MCPSNKVPYASRRAAEETAQWFLKGGGEKTWAYRCRECPMFHLTSKYPPKWRREHPKFKESRP